MKPLLLLFCVELFKDSRRDTAYKTIVGERLSYDRTCRDRNIVAQSYTAKNYRTGTDPTVIADCDRFCIGFTEVGFRILVKFRITSVTPVNRV